MGREDLETGAGSPKVDRHRARHTSHDKLTTRSLFSLRCPIPIRTRHTGTQETRDTRDISLGRNRSTVLSTCRFGISLLYHNLGSSTDQLLYATESIVKSWRNEYSLVSSCPVHSYWALLFSNAPSNCAYSGLFRQCPHGIPIPGYRRRVIPDVE